MMVLFLDLDGTVIGSRGAAEDTLTAIDAARAQGLTMSVCTGRPCAGIAQRLAARMSDGPHIFENGAVVKRSTGAALLAEPLDPADLHKLIAHTRHTSAVLELYTADTVYVSEFNADCRRHAEVLEVEVVERDLDWVAQTQKVVRAHWIMRPENVEQTLLPTLDASEIGVASSPVLPENVFASITRRGVSKGSAASYVADFYGAQLADCWGVGDSLGDLPLLEAVGRAMVMQEAPESLRGRFEVLPGVDDGGVVRAIELALG